MKTIFPTREEVGEAGGWGAGKEGHRCPWEGLTTRRGWSGEVESQLIVC